MPEFGRVLITGGCGFIGANLVRYVSEHTSSAVRVVDDLRAGRRAYVGDRAEVIVGDVSDEATLLPCLKGVDAVVHLASQTGVGPSVEDPVRDFEGNTSATFRVLEACRMAGIAKVVYASSGAAVGEAGGALNEDVVPRPASPYGAGKLAGEAYCAAYARAFEMRTVALRFANVYGPFSEHKNNAIPNFLSRCLSNEPIDIYGDGSQTRDFINVDDICAAVLTSLETEGVAGEVFQLGTGVETSILALADLVREVTDSRSPTRFKPRRSGEVFKSRADISKARAALRFEPRVSLRQGLERTASWYRRAAAPRL